MRLTCSGTFRVLPARGRPDFSDSRCEVHTNNARRCFLRACDTPAGSASATQLNRDLRSDDSKLTPADAADDRVHHHQLHLLGRQCVHRERWTRAKCAHLPLHCPRGWPRVGVPGARPAPETFSNTFHWPALRRRGRPGFRADLVERFCRHFAPWSAHHFRLWARCASVEQTGEQ